MTMTRRSLALLAAVPILARPALAAWPDRPARIIVPFPAGGGLDLVGRLLAEPIGRAIGQTIVIENVAGAGGAIGIDALSRAQPDGYSFGISSGSTITLGPQLRATPYDPWALTHISRLVVSPFLLVAGTDTPYTDLAALLQRMRQRPDSVRFASAGVGTSTHLGIEWLNQKLGTRTEPVHYRGAAPALTDIYARNADVLISDATAWPLVQQGRLRLLAVSSAERWAPSPGTPTIAEAVPGVSFDNWYGLIAPGGVPAPVTERMAAESARALARPEVIERLEASGFTPAPLAGPAFAARLRTEAENWRGVLAAGNITVG
ncbi:tripartite tricarboxylate transporter substrate binding protein [Roseomonas terrae]|jgi:tripartite-type tricarboxylate transporter receptor subunit TctC|uniref:Tripartite tricarboxylate transporter substrate binding protein n=1 Tax=Neoroseomonas terrae TaxID=424799 RepID=A0ABS5EIN4_9PROT|nr:tripartite tricarboxylate transporter substrate binding protein [Neoroseomonas terrae]MBR0650882.1 tripartite tricarboxylate transporter substrate binding protein [Neoroseomonas terrae]